MCQVHKPKGECIGQASKAKVHYFVTILEHKIQWQLIKQSSWMNEEWGKLSKCSSLVHLKLRVWLHPWACVECTAWAVTWPRPSQVGLPQGPNLGRKWRKTGKMGENNRWGKLRKCSSLAHLRLRVWLRPWARAECMNTIYYTVFQLYLFVNCEGHCATHLKEWVPSHLTKLSD